MKGLICNLKTREALGKYPRDWDRATRKSNYDVAVRVFHYFIEINQKNH